ncbi:MAG: leucyl aminopeptidase family protein [Alphaproteobacteria bacterium]
MPLNCLTDKAGKSAIPLIPVKTGTLAAAIEKLGPRHAAWVGGTGYRARPGAVLPLPGEDGAPEAVLVGVEDDEDLWSWGGASAVLPPGRYRIEADLSARAARRAALGWALGAYRFTRYKRSSGGKPAVLAWPAAADRAAVTAAAEATYLARDLINTPAADLGPEELTDAAEALAAEFGGECLVLEGDELLAEKYPAIHAVGRAAAREPRLADLRWGDPKHPRVTLVGKGVCFDSGGLDLKPARGMKLMKKDMGGAACVLGLARMIMAAALPVRLRVLVPAVENSVSGNAMRPLDVLATRKGLTVEVGNTDAEGRLVLADALAAAVEEKPDLLLDFATLTGAARAAVGTEIAAMFSPDDELAAALYRHGGEQDDPVWRMPLWRPYRRLIDSPVADINNSGDSAYAGAITAALFLADFVGDTTAWAHFDIMAWNVSRRPGRPEGGEAMAMRAAFATIAERFGGG